MKKQNTWILQSWDGNPALNLQCWRKKFGRGHVSVGVGDFTLICYSYGPDSPESMSGTRNRGDKTWTEQEAMDYVDAMKGKARSANPVPLP